MRVSLCVGDYAAAPFFVAGIELPVYCVEELCICIRENAFFIDKSLMSEDLVEWIGSRCGLTELARRLEELLKDGAELNLFVREIMDYAGLFEETVVKEIDEVLKRGAGRSSFEKRKERVDYLVAKKKYAAAIRGYDNLLKHWNEFGDEDKETAKAGMKAAILHNKGVAYTGMMQYDNAAKMFSEAYELTGEMAEQVSFLAAKRLHLSESEYVAFVSEQPDSYSGTLQLEKQMNLLKNEWEKQADHQRLAFRKQMRRGADKQRYYAESDRLIQALEDNYRDCVEI